MYINKEKENGNILKERKNGDGNSDSAEVISRKILLGSRRSLFRATGQLEIQTPLQETTLSDLEVAYCKASNPGDSNFTEF